MQKILYALSLALLLVGAFVYWQEEQARSPEAVLELAAQRRAAAARVSSPPVADADNRWIPFLEALEAVREIDAGEAAPGTVLSRVFEVEGFVDEENPELSLEHQLAFLSDPRVIRALTALEEGRQRSESSFSGALRARGRSEEEGLDALKGSIFLRFVVSLSSAEHARERRFTRVIDLVEALSILSIDLAGEPSRAAYAMGIGLSGIPGLRSNYWSDIHSLDSVADRMRLDSVLRTWEQGFLDHRPILDGTLEDSFTYLEKQIQQGGSYAQECAQAYLELGEFEAELRSLFELNPEDTRVGLSLRVAPELGVGRTCSRLQNTLQSQRQVLINLRLARFANAYLMPEESRIAVPERFSGGAFEVVEDSGRVLIRYRNSEGEIDRALGPRP